MHRNSNAKIPEQDKEMRLIFMKILVLLNLCKVHVYLFSPEISEIKKILVTQVRSKCIESLCIGARHLTFVN